MATASTGKKGFRLGKYEVIRHIAAGGMAAVYRGVDSETGKEVALKILPAEKAARPQSLERFRREAYHGSKLRHENIVTLFEFGEAQGIYFLAMEYVEGVNLHDYIDRRGPLPPPVARGLTAQIAAALDHAHHLGIVHRDIKPANILLTRVEGRVLAKLTDYGLAFEINGEEDFKLTRDGATVGTVDYMSPEQARESRSADVRSDIYSLGCSLYHMLTGRPPFAEGTLTERVLKHVSEEPADVRRLNPRVPEDLAQICRRMLAKNPANRYQTPADLMADLAREEEPPVVKEAPQAEAPATMEPPATELVTSPSAPFRTSTQETFINLSVFSSTQPSPTEGSSEQQRIAQGQFQKAAEVMQDGNFEYGLPLLLNCCRLEPANLVYRHALRQAQEQYRKRQGTQGIRDILHLLVLHFRLYWSRFRGRHRDVLVHGERILLRRPHDLGTHLAMAEAAEKGGFLPLAVWILERAREIDEDNIPVNRALALIFEKQGEFLQAQEFWKHILKADSHNVEAARKIRDLSARETIDRGRFHERIAGGQRE